MTETVQKPAAEMHDDLSLESSTWEWFHDWRPYDLMRLRAKLAMKFAAASPLKDKVARDVFADAVAGQVIHARLQQEKSMRGTITSEESRALPGLLTGMIRIAKDLGLTLRIEDTFGID